MSIMIDIANLKSDPNGVLQPPLTWNCLPKQVKQSIEKLSSELWQSAIDRYAVELYYYKLRNHHENFLSELSKVKGDIYQHTELLRSHHYALHGKQDPNLKTKPAFKLNDIVKDSNDNTGKIVGMYWRLWNNPGWSYLVEWDEVTGDGYYYSETKLTLL